MPLQSKGRDSQLKIYAEYLVYIVFRLIEEAICLISKHERALAVGRFFGRIGYIIAWDRRQVAIENLTIAFSKERSQKEIRLLARKNFEHLGMLGVEFFRLRRWNHEELAERLTINGGRNFQIAWSPGLRGVFYITAHYGSFEVLAAMSRFLGVTINLVVTPSPNRFINRRMIFKRGGDASGLRILPHKGIVHRVINALKAGEAVVVLADQRGDDNRPVWVDFFGRKVLANGVFARFATDGDAYSFPIMGLRTNDGKYYCEFGDEIPIQISDNRSNDVMVNSQLFHDIFEQWLREHPEQGFWMHRKFKRKRKSRKKQAITYRPSLGQQKPQEAVPVEAQVTGKSTAQR